MLMGWLISKGRHRFKEAAKRALNALRIPFFGPEILLKQKLDLQPCFLPYFPPCRLGWSLIFFKMTTRWNPLLKLRMQNE